MPEVIKDGRSGDTMKVDVHNRAHTQSLSVDAELHEHLEGNAYDISTGGLINLSSSISTGMLYIENTGDPDLIVDAIFVDGEAANNGVGNGTLTWNLNPTGGTMYDNASAAQTVNRRMGNPVALSHISYKATSNGQTLTGGTTIDFPFVDGISVVFTKPFVIPKGQAFGISYAPPPTNDSMNIQIGCLIIVDTTGSV